MARKTKRNLRPAVFDGGKPTAASPLAQSLVGAALAAERGSVVTENLMSRDRDSAWMVPYWDKTDAIIDGIEAVRATGTKFLPKFNDETNEEYANRLICTKMTNVYRDIVESLSSKPFEQEVSLVDADEQPQEILDFIEDVDGLGNNLTMFASSTFFNGVNSAIDWIFVDYPNVGEGVRTVSQARAENIRPFWSHVLGRNVLAARYVMENSKAVLSYMRLYEPPNEGERDRVRVFKRLQRSMDDGGGNVVVWELWEKTERATLNAPEFTLIDTGNISIGVIPLVPFITGRREGRSLRIHPVLRDAADLQIDLYQDESALKYNKVISGYSMLSASGVTPEKNPDGSVKRVPIGPLRILYGGMNPQTGQAGEWKFIQPSAEMSKFLSEDIKQTIQNLRELGKQPLTAQSGNLTTVTTAVAAGKSKSAVQAMCQNLKDTLENAFVLTYMWLTLPVEDAPSVNVFDEFDNIVEGDADLVMLREMRKEGDLSRETYWDEVKRRRVLSSEFTPERERERMLKEVPGDNPVITDG